MASDIAYFQASTEEDLRLEIDFGGSFDLAAKTLRVEIRERASAALKTTLTVGAGLTVTLPGKVVAYVAKTSLAGWTRGEYTADLIDTSASMQRRIVPVRFLYDEPGRLPGGVKGNSATVMVSNNQVVVTAVRGETGPIGATGPANSLTIGTVTNLPPGSTASAEITGTAPNQVLNLSVVRGLDGIGGPTDQGYQALLRQMELEAALARLPTPITELPSLNLDFLFDTYFVRKVSIAASLTVFLAAVGGSFTRASAAWYFDATGTLVQAANNVPRLDHDPVTLARLGYLAEGVRTNGVRINTMVGAVAGAPGTLPTNWSGAASNNGIAREVIGVGQENGIDYIDLRFSGTASANGLLSIEFDTRTAIVAAAGQTWTLSAFCRLVAGSMAGLSGTMWLFDADASGALTGGGNSAAFGPTSAALRGQRPAVTRTLADAGTARVVGQWRVSFSAGAVINATIRIGLPQAEPGAVASSPVKTAGAAVTRAADGLWLPTSSWFSQTNGTLLIAAAKKGAGYSEGLVSLHDTTNNNIIWLRQTSLQVARLEAVSGGVQQVVLDSGVLAAGSHRTAAAWAPGSAAASTDGVVAVTGAGSVPAGLSRLQLGDGSGGNPLTGYIASLLYFPYRLTNAQVQALSGASL